MATQRQKALASKILENIGKPMGEVMREVGYSKNYSDNPQLLTRTEGWQELMEKYLPEEKIAKRHGELLDALTLEHYIFPSSEDDKVIQEIVESLAGCTLMQIRKQHQWKRAYYWTPDHKSRKYAIEMAYKLRGRYEPEKIKLIDPYADMTSEELLEKRRLVEERIAQMKKYGQLLPAERITPP